MDRKELKPELLKTRQHFEILDGLRGIAALAIVIFHFMEWIFSDYRQNFIGHGFLAVDFFFCLSGFVIGYAYDSRIQAIGTLEFFKSRLIRLHPLVIFGAVLGLAGFLLDPFSSGVSRKLCIFSGKISYPLYMTHYWAIWIFGNYFLKHRPGGGQLAVIVVLGTLFLVGFAYLVMVFYDIPTRKYLALKREQKLKRGALPVLEPAGK